MKGGAVGGAAGDGDEALRGGEGGGDVEEGEAGDLAGRAFDPGGVGDAAAEHLVAAAQPEDGAAAAGVGDDVDGEAGGAQAARSAMVDFRAGEDDEVGVGGEDGACAKAEEVDGGLGVERVEVVEVGDVGQDRDGDAEAAAAAGVGGAGEGEGVLGGQAGGGVDVGHEAERGPAGAGGDQRHAVGEERRGRRGSG